MVRFRKVLFLVISFIISFVTLFSIISLTMTQETFDIFKRINIFYLLLAITFHITAWLIWSTRLKVMSDFIGKGRNGYNLKIRNSVKIILVDYFAASITPSQFGGEFIRIYLLSNNGLSIGDSTVVVIGERILDFFVIVTGGIISFIIFREILPHDNILYSVFTWLGVVLLIFIIFVSYFLLNPDKFKKFVELFLFRIIKFRRFEGLRDRILVEFKNFCHSLDRFKYEGKRVLGIALILTILFWITEFSLISLILVGFGENPMWMYSVAAQFIIAMVMSLPVTPGSSGIAEISFAYIFSFIVSSSLLGILTLTWRLIMFYLNLTVGAIASIKIIGEIFNRS